MMWIARDKNSKLFLYAARPKMLKKSGQYVPTGKNTNRVMMISAHRFPDQRWGDAPRKVAVIG